MAEDHNTQCMKHGKYHPNVDQGHLIPPRCQSNVQCFLFIYLLVLLIKLLLLHVCLNADKLTT